MFFDERNMLVGSGVKDGGRTVKREDLVEERVISDAAEVEVRFGGDASQILLEIVEAILRGFEDNGARAGKSEAVRECGADGTARACDENGVLNER